MLLKKLLLVMGIAYVYFSGNAVDQKSSSSESEAINPMIPNFDPMSGWSIDVRDNIAVITGNHDTSFIDISNPRAPTVLNQFQMQNTQ